MQNYYVLNLYFSFNSITSIFIVSSLSINQSEPRTSYSFLIYIYIAAIEESSRPSLRQFDDSMYSIIIVILFDRNTFQCTYIERERARNEDTNCLTGGSSMMMYTCCLFVCLFVYLIFIYAYHKYPLPPVEDVTYHSVYLFGESLSLPDKDRERPRS